MLSFKNKRVFNKILKKSPQLEMQYPTFFFKCNRIITYYFYREFYDASSINPYQNVIRLHTVFIMFTFIGHFKIDYLINLLRMPYIISPPTVLAFTLIFIF